MTDYADLPMRTIHVVPHVATTPMDAYAKRIAWYLRDTEFTIARVTDSPGLKRIVINGYDTPEVDAYDIVSQMQDDTINAEVVR